MVEDALQEFEETYSLKRFTSDSEALGNITQVFAAAVDFLAVIQPMSDKDLRNVPEGQNSLDWISCWSEVDFALKDLVTYNGIDYEVAKKGRWEETPYFKYSLVSTEDRL